ncbi:MAG: Protein involved in biosynthesis of mitomycin antibiotics/polyketide [Planctomycetota bacterium]|nr:MAG: Protein involved in biosynthesis of mitomycin antibiotics/polyketide [Planctomycetota bacterium]
MSHRSKLDSDGTVVIEGLFSASEILALGTALDAVTGGTPQLPEDLRDLLTLERDLAPRQRGEITPEQAGDCVFLVGELQRFAPTFEALITHPKILETLEALFESRDFAFHFMNATVKSAHVGSKVGWHRDWPNKYLCGATSNQVRLMLCIDGMRQGEGALEVVRGSHSISDEQARTAKPRGREWRPDEIATIDCAPGALVALHSKLVHGSGPNRSPRARRNILMQWGGPGCDLVGEAREMRTGWQPIGTLDNTNVTR